MNICILCLISAWQRLQSTQTFFFFFNSPGDLFHSVGRFVRFCKKQLCPNRYFSFSAAGSQKDSVGFIHVDDSRPISPSSCVITLSQERRRGQRHHHRTPPSTPPPAPSEQTSHQPAARRPRRTASPSDRLQRGSAVECGRLMKTLKKS